MCDDTIQLLTQQEREVKMVKRRSSCTEYGFSKNVSSLFSLNTGKNVVCVIGGFCYKHKDNLMSHGEKCFSSVNS